MGKPLKKHQTINSVQSKLLKTLISQHKLDDFDSDAVAAPAYVSKVMDSIKDMTTEMQENHADGDSAIIKLIEALDDPQLKDLEQHLKDQKGSGEYQQKRIVALAYMLVPDIEKVEIGVQIVQAAECEALASFGSILLSEHGTPMGDTYSINWESLRAMASADLKYRVALRRKTNGSLDEVAPARVERRSFLHFRITCLVCLFSLTNVLPRNRTDRRHSTAKQRRGQRRQR